MPDCPIHQATEESYVKSQCNYDYKKPSQQANERKRKAERPMSILYQNT